MKPQLAMKSIIRAPVRSLLTFVLLCAVSFAFTMQTAEYVIMSRELGSAAGSYYGVGSVEIEPPEIAEREAGYPNDLTLSGTATGRYKLLPPELIGEISALPYITSIDARYMTAGVSNNYTRIDDGAYFFDFSARGVIEATFSGEKTEYPEYMGEKPVSVYVDNVIPLAGRFPGRAGVNSMLNGYEYDWPTVRRRDISAGFDDKAYTVSYIGLHDYGSEQLKALEAGKRYVFVGRYELPPYMTEFSIGDYLSDDWCAAVWDIDGAPEGYLELEEYAPLRELIEMTDADLHTFDMVYTEDMRCIMGFASGKMMIAEGRALSPEDSAAGARVCVVSDEFAKKNRVGIGDTVTVSLGHKLFEQYLNLGAIAGSRGRYEAGGEDASLEVVGIYANTISAFMRSADPHWGYSVNAIFVPKSLLPAGAGPPEGHMFAPGEFSFRVGDVGDIGAFLDEVAPVIEGMGLTLIFEDGGWLGIEREFMAARRLSLVRAVVYLLAAAAAAGLGAYLSIARRRKDYAIMRALGTPKTRAAWPLVLPLAALSAISAAIGGAAACAYTASAVEQNNALVLLQGYAVDSSIPAATVAGCLAAQVLLTLAFAATILRHIGGQPPLALLQKGGGRA